MTFEEAILTKRPLLADGATGTMLQSMGLPLVSHLKSGRLRTLKPLRNLPADMLKRAPTSFTPTLSEQTELG